MDVELTVPVEITSEPRGFRLSITSDMNSCLLSPISDRDNSREDIELQPSSEADFIFHFPNEIQKLIFEAAARLNGRYAFQLCKVSRYVFEWTQPILYERVVVRDIHAALCLIRTVTSKPRGYFWPRIKSLTLYNDIQPGHMKIILAECSRAIILCTVFLMRNRTPSSLPFIRSPHIRRLTVVCENDPLAQHTYCHTPYYVPLPILGSLTHLTIVINHYHVTWGTLVRASRAHSSDNQEDHAALHAFQTLTHLAVSHFSQKIATTLRNIAKNLRYIAVLEPPNFPEKSHTFLVNSFKNMNDERFLVLKGLGIPEAWSVDDGWTPSEFWPYVEYLVDQGYISDRGEMRAGSFPA